MNKINPTTCVATSNLKIDIPDNQGRNIVLYFYPKDDTPGCTIETNDFNKLLPKFKKLDCEIYGISKDSLKSHDKFKDKYKVKFDLLFSIADKMLHDQVREKDNLVYSITMSEYFDQFKPIEMISFYTYFGSDPENVEIIKNKKIWSL